MNETIRAHAYDIKIKDNYPNDENDTNNALTTEIRLWCLTPESKTILCRVTNFPYIAKLEMPIVVNRFAYKWDNDSADKFIEILNHHLEFYHEEKIVFYKLIYSRRLYYYSTIEYPYIEVHFATKKSMMKAMKICENIEIDEEEINIVFRESDISIHNKMFTLMNMSTTDNFYVEGRHPKFKITEKDFDEYIIDWKTFRKDDEKWVTTPLEMSFDIETYSNNHKKFPSAARENDIIYSISAVFSKGKDIIKKFFIVLDDCEQLEDKEVEIIECKSEQEVISMFFQLIKLNRPNLITGHNIFSFDLPYIYERYKTIPGMGDIPNVSVETDYVPNIKNIDWSSSAYGKNVFSYVDYPGIIYVDTLPYVRRDFKFPDFTLNTISKRFLGEEKDDLKIQDMFKLMEYNIKCRQKKFKGEKLTEEEILTMKKNNKIIGKYNVQDTVLVTRIVEILKVWLTIIIQAGIVRITPTEIFTRGQQIRCEAQLYSYASKRNITLTTREKPPVFFAGGKVEKPKVGYWPIMLCYDFNSLYPSTIIAYNIDYTTLIRDPEHIKAIGEENVNIFDIVQEEPVNYEITKDDIDITSEDSDDDFEDTPKKKVKSKETVTRKYRYAFVKPNVYKGLLPEIEEFLLSERKKEKKEMQKCKDKAKELINKGSPSEIQYWLVATSVCDVKQNAIKVSANSMYGFFGSQVHGKYSLVEASKCVTSRGRESITIAGQYFVDNYNANIIYGDTDSVMITVPNATDAVKAIEIAHKLEKDINSSGIFPPPLYIEFEKCMSAVTIKPKHYFYRIWQPDGTFQTDRNGDIVLVAKGVVIARRDRSKLVTDTYRKLANNILDGKSFLECLEDICNTVADILTLSNGVLDKLSMIRTMGGRYKNKSYPLSIASNEMERIGRPILQGERFSYVIVEDYLDRDKMGYKIRPLDMFKEIYSDYGIKIGQSIDGIKKKDDLLPPPEKIDAYYYVKSLSNCLDTLLKTVYTKDIEKYSDVSYKPVVHTRMRKIFFENPLQFIVKIIKDKGNCKEAIELIENIPAVLDNVK